MKKNGFTLLEILIIIIIIGIITTIAITSSLGSSKRINQKLYEEKIDYVLTAATQFGQASTDFFTEECKFLEEPVADSKCFHIKAQTLLDNNFIKVEDIKDPRDVSKNISEVKIEVQYYFDRIHAVVYDDEITTSGFVTINNGAAETNTRSVSLTISSSLSDTTNAEMCVSNTNTCTDWRKYETLIAWELSNEAGEKTVSVWFRDRLKTVHGPVKDSILFVPSASTGTFVINDGAPYTGSRSVTLKITMNTAETYVTSMCISNTNTCTAWRPFATLVGNWMLTENDGLKTVKVWFRDESGNHFSDLTDTIIYETVKPTGTIAIEAGEYTNKRAVNLILSAVDHESGMDSMCISNTTICDDTKWETYKTSVTGHLLEDLDGDQTVSVWYRDKVGNVSIRYYATTKLDRLPPSEAKVLINNNAPYTKSRDVVLTLSAKDDVSKVASVCVSQSKPCLIFTPFTATYPLTLTGSEGVRTVYAIFRDHAGNDSVQVEDSIILDLTKPVCGNTWTPNPATWKTIPATQEFTLTGSTDAGGSGIASSFKCIAAATNNATCMATVSDNAGNSITCGPSPVNRIDITPPNRTVHNPISQDWTNKNITVTFTSADSESQVASYKYCVTNNGTQCEPTTTGDSVTLTNQGQYTICSLALNHAGLPSIKTCSAANAYKIDKTDPTCGSTWTPNPANWKASGAQTFTLTGSTDSGGSGLTAASFTCATGATHGTTCNATITDKAGNTKTCGPSPINRIDTTIPTTPTFSPTSRDWTNGSIVVTFTASDPESGISSYKYCTTTNGTQCEPTTTGSSVTLINQGQYTVCALAINRVGRSGEKNCSATNAYKIDKTNPTCGSTWTPNPANWKASGTQTFTLTGSADLGGSGLTATSFTCTTGTTHGTTCNATVKDKAGNSVICGPSPINRVDSSGPTPPTLSINSRGWANTNVTISFSSSDPESGISSYKYCSTVNGTQCEPSIAGSSITLSTTGQHTVCALAVNNVGRTSTKTCSTANAFKIDKVPPTCVSSGGSTAWRNTNLTITGTCSDTGGSGCVGNSTNVYSTNTNITTGHGGTVKDNAGNSVTCPGNQTVKIDKTPPTCVSSGGSTAWRNTNLTLTGKCSDTGGSGCVGNSTNVYSSNTNITTGHGGTVKDNAGNSVTCPKNQTVKIDKTPPTCVSSGGSTAWRNTNLTITGTCSDTGGSGCVGNATKTISTNTNSTTQSPGTVKDNAGNSVTCPANQTVKIDKTPPTCVSSGGSTAWRNTNLTITGTCSDTGGSGCVGNSTNVYSSNTNITTGHGGTVKDNAGNSVTCPKNQTVRIDKTPPTCVSSGGSTAWRNTNLTITGTCSDTGGSGCVGNSTNVYSSNTNITTGHGGTVKDNAGNSVTCPKNQTVRIDKTPPTCVSSGGSTAWRNTNLTLTGKCSDTGGSGCVGNATKTISTNTNSTTQSPGTVKDNAGNSVTCPANQTVRIDKTPPTCVSSGGSTAWRNTNLTITGTCSDTGGSGCVGNSTNVYSTNTNITTGHGGTVKDNAGNSVTCPKNQTVRIDKTPPTCVSSGGSTAWRNTNLTITGTCSDTGGSGCVGNSTNVYSTNTNITTGHGGTVKDNAGNSVTCPKNQTVRIDKTPPTCVSSGGSTAWRNTNLTITGRCSDTGGSGCVGNSTNVYSSNTNITTGHGGTVKDNAGNSVTCPKNQTVKIDKTPPTCVSSGGSTAWRNTNLTITGKCSDTGGSGCVGNATKTISTNTNSTTQSPGTVKDNAGNSVTCPANQTVKIDKTPPTCTVTKSNTYTTAGVTVKVTGSDSGSGIASGNVTETGIKANKTYTVTDNVGLTGTCKVTISSRTEYRTRSCTQYKSCQNSSCGWNSCLTGSNTCVGGNKSCRTSGCGVELYKSCRTAACGCETYNSCPASVCGVSAYKYCQHSSCGWNPCLTGSNTCVGGYNSCRTSGCGVELYKSCATAGCGVAQYKSCKHSECGYKRCTNTACCGTYCNSYGHIYECYQLTGGYGCGTKCASSTPTSSGQKWYKTTKTCCLSSEPATCTKACCGYATCRTAGCGIESYKTCRHSECGVERYNYCQHSSCGWNSCLTGSNTCVGGYNSCRASGCGVESYKSCPNSSCTCATNKSCRAQACGVERYNYCQNSACGWDPCLTGSNTCVGGYNSCRTSGCGCETWGTPTGWTTTACSSTASTQCESRVVYY